MFHAHLETGAQIPKELIHSKIPKTFEERFRAISNTRMLLYPVYSSSIINEILYLALSLTFHLFSQQSCATQYFYFNLIHFFIDIKQKPLKQMLEYF